MSDADPRDEGLGRLYRGAGGDEPPAGLDAAILAAARREAAAPPQRATRAGWRRWGAPAGVLATGVIAASIALLAPREPTPAMHDEMSARRDQAPAVSPPKEDATAPRQSHAGDAAISLRSEQALRDLAPPPEIRLPSPAANAPLPPPALEVAPGISVERAAPQKPAETQSANKTEAVAPIVNGMPASKAAVAGSMAPTRDAARNPEFWIEDIRRLRRENKLVEARQQLDAFKRAYPAYQLPEDIKVP